MECCWLDWDSAVLWEHLVSSWQYSTFSTWRMVMTGGGTHHVSFSYIPETAPWEKEVFIREGSTFACHFLNALETGREAVTSSLRPRNNFKIRRKTFSFKAKQLGNLVLD